MRNIKSFTKAALAKAQSFKSQLNAGILEFNLGINSINPKIQKEDKIRFYCWQESLLFGPS